MIRIRHRAVSGSWGGLLRTWVQNGAHSGLHDRLSRDRGYATAPVGIAMTQPCVYPAYCHISAMDKTEIARRQLGTALSLFLEDQDPVSVHVLACAGMEIADHLSLKAGAQPFRINGQEGNALTDVEYGNIRSEFANAFKHATRRKGVERDDSAILADFSDVNNDERLFIGWCDFASAGNPHPIESHVLISWFMGMHAHLLDTPHGRVILREIDPFFPGIRDLPRERQKTMLKKQIVQAKKNRKMMARPLIDPRPLRLGPIK